LAGYRRGGGTLPLDSPVIAHDRPMIVDIRGASVAEDDAKARLARRLELYRARTARLIEPLNDDDIHRQHAAIMGPLVWDVGHVGNFEELWLLRKLDGRPAHDPTYDKLYNPFDNQRWTRGELPLLNRDEALDYINEVRGDALNILRGAELGDGEPLARDGYVFRMVIQHEAQHQETMLQALDLRDDLAPYPLADFRPTQFRPVDDAERVVIAGGPFLMGTDDRTEAYDNERPRHRVEVGEFAIDRFPATNRRYARFIEAAGYERADLWSRDGWAWRQSVDHAAPQGWAGRGWAGRGWAPRAGGDPLIRRFGHVREMSPAAPVQHLSFHEAEAFARFEGGRLPTEAEWEKAAAWGPGASRPRIYPWGSAPPSARLANLGVGAWGPAPVGSYPAGASAYGVEQMLGDVYEWTSSPFKGYPDFRAFPYREYSEVFFDDDKHRVLRGASWATAPEVARNTFRNWDLPIRRQIFSGVRLAWDI